jgi:hypothetical protein
MSMKTLIKNSPLAFWIRDCNTTRLGRTSNLVGILQDLINRFDLDTTPLNLVGCVIRDSLVNDRLRCHRSSFSPARPGDKH